MKLRTATINVKQFPRGLEVLRDMESLQEIHAQPFGAMAPADFWKRYDAGEFKK